MGIGAVPSTGYKVRGAARGTMEADMKTIARVLNGIEIAKEIKTEVAAEVRLLAAAGITPGLAVVLVGHVAASEIYVRSKVKTDRGKQSEGLKVRDTKSQGIVL